MPRKRKRTEPLGSTIAVGNQKGGVGKTTNTVHLAAALGERGYSVLIIDLDPAAGATKHFGIPPKRYAGTFELILRPDPVPSELAVTEGLPRGVSIIPSRTELSEIDKYISKYVDNKSVLKAGVEKARSSYDVIFLDTPPSAGFTTTVAAYSTAEWFLLSAFPHALSMYGLNEALSDIADVRAHRNPGLEVLGVVISGVDARTKGWIEIEQIIRNHLPGRAFKTIISQAAAIPECSAKGKVLFQIPAFRRHKVTEQYRKLAREIERRILDREAFLAGKLAEDDREDAALGSGDEESLAPELVVEDAALVPGEATE